MNAKRFAAVLGAVLLSLTITVPALAQQPASGGTDKPEVRQTQKKAEGETKGQKRKKKPAARVPKPIPREGSELEKKPSARYQKPGSNPEAPEAKKPESRGAEGPDIRRKSQ